MVITGANAAIYINGSPLLFAGGVSVQHQNKLDEIPQLDSLEVAEYAESGHRCSVTMTSFRLAPGATLGGQPVANSATDFNLDFHNNGQNGVIVDVKQILLQPELLIEIYDGDTPIYVAQGGKFEGGTGQLNARGIWEGSWTFRCRRGTGI